TSMKPFVLRAAALLMVLLAFTVYMFMGDPNSPTAMMAMAAVSTGMMTFLVIFGIVYTKPKSDTDRFMELYGDKINGEKKE
ncbi:MAG: hypothetical protein ACI38Y_00455, partial [Candidatus Methanomethylophilaceae archaeon]